MFVLKIMLFGVVLVSAASGLGDTVKSGQQTEIRLFRAFHHCAVAAAFLICSRQRFYRQRCCEDTLKIILLIALASIFLTKKRVTHSNFLVYIFSVTLDSSHFFHGKYESEKLA